MSLKDLLIIQGNANSAARNIANERMTAYSILGKLDHENNKLFYINTWR